MNSFEHGFVEEEGAAMAKKDSATLLAEEPAKSGNRNTVWNAKVRDFCFCTLKKSSLLDF